MELISRGAILLLMLSALTACGGDDGDAVPPEANKITAKTLSTSQAMSEDLPSLVLDNGRGTTVEYYPTLADDGSDQVLQAVYGDAASGIRARSIFDEDGRLTRIIDETTGSQIVIEELDNRVDFKIFDAAGVYVGGVAVLQQGSSIAYASIDGTPVFDGQLTGQLDGAGDDGSFVLVSDPASGLSQVTTLTPELSGALLAAVAGSSAQASAKAGASAMAAQGMAARGFFADIKGDLLKTGLMLIGSGVAVAVLAPAAGTAAIGMAAAGFGTVFLSQYLPAIERRAENEFTEGQSLFDYIESKLDETGSDIKETVRGAFDALDTGGELTTVTFPKSVEQALDRARDQVSGLLDELDFPDVTQLPDVVSTALEGEGIDQSNTLYDLEGQVTPDGTLSVQTPPSAGDTLEIDGTVDVDSGAFSGTFDGSRLGSGTASGSEEEFGDCAVAQGSGGQGTFSFAHNLGASNGAFSFFYDAFSIPDAFTVRNNGQQLFSTGGLVSGSSTQTLSLAGSSIVFVQVSAPEDGTLWVYEVGCP